MKTMDNSISQACAYLPSFPPPRNKKSSYSRFDLSAPVVALSDITTCSKKAAKFQLSTNCRARIQVGNTNRWRIPVTLESDLLGRSQAIRSVESSRRPKKDIITTDDIASRLQTTERSTNNRLANSYHMRSGLKSAPLPSRSHRSRDSLHLSSEYRRTVSRSDSEDERDACRIFDESLSFKKIAQMQRGNFYISPERRQPTPLETFLRCVHIASKHNSIDLIISALNTNWNMHLRYVEGSQLIARLIEEAIEENQCNRKVSGESGDQSDFFITSCERQGVSVSVPRNPSYTAVAPIFVDLDVKDKLITRHALADALSFLYDDQRGFHPLDVINILATAHFLQIKALKDRCAEMMIDTIDTTNACLFHSAAVQYDIETVKEHCEKWLLLHLVPNFSSEGYLAHLTRPLLERLLKSHSLFAFSEYSLFKLLCNWVFLKYHPTLKILPSWGSVVTYFISISINVSFLESDEGKQFYSLFETMRLIGITDSSHVEEMIKMNVLPSDWLLSVLTQHYYSLQGGGDMSLLARFEEGAIRHGFILNEPSRSCRILLSLHGFHFAVTAEFEDDNGCLIYMQRLQPTDPSIDKIISDRHTFSIRCDREVRYAIRAHYFDGQSFISEQLGPRTQGFGLSNRSGKSEVLRMASPTLPLFITFSLLFPPS